VLIAFVVFQKLYEGSKEEFGDEGHAGYGLLWFLR